MWCVRGNNKAYLGLHGKCPIFLTDFNKILTFLTDFDRSSQHQISVNSSGGNRADTGEQSDGRPDVMALTGAFRDYAKSPNTNYMKTGPI
jgi:hypothetical protein